MIGPTAAAAAERLPGPIPATVLRVVDGDTLAVRAHIWLGQEVDTSVRLIGADAPELHGRCPAEREAAERARVALAHMVEAPEVTLEDVRVDKYGGRVLARVRGADGRDLSEALLRGGLAAPYAGGRRGDWCARLASAPPGPPD